MKIETMVYDRLKNLIPPTAERTILFACVGDTSHELYFYSLFTKNGYKQCFSLAEEDLLDENELDKAFEDISILIRKDKNYKSGEVNVYTFILEKTKMELQIDYYKRNFSVYKIKKNWEQKYLLCSVRPQS